MYMFTESKRGQWCRNIPMLSGFKEYQHENIPVLVCEQISQVLLFNLAPQIPVMKLYEYKESWMVQKPNSFPVMNFKSWIEKLYEIDLGEIISFWVLESQDIFILTPMQWTRENIKKNKYVETIDAW